MTLYFRGNCRLAENRHTNVAGSLKIEYADKLVFTFISTAYSMAESHNLEWKESWHDDYLRWVSGFANADGGALVIGKNDKGKAIGLAGARKLLEDLPNKIRDLLGVAAQVKLEQEDGKEYLEIVTPAYPNPISYRGRYYQRSGSTLQELKGAADLSPEAIARFRQLAANSGRLDTGALSESDARLLDKLKLTEGKYLKRAAVLLFHPDPLAFMTGAFVKVGFFRPGGDLVYHDEISRHGRPAAMAGEWKMTLTEISVVPQNLSGLIKQISDTTRRQADVTKDVKMQVTVSTKVVLDLTVIEMLTNVLSVHFANGLRLNSPIELARFRGFVSDDLSEEISLSDEKIMRYISACGTTFDGKVYAVSAQTKERIKELAEKYFADGAQAIFFAEFYSNNENWLFGASVVSKNMLIGILRRLFPNLSFTQTYFGYTDASVFSTLESEILRVWDGDVLLTYDQLAERLPYIPLERIKYALGQNGDFIWNSVETFSHISRIEITDDEREVICADTMRECNARGYVSITDLPFGEIKERNYELSVTAVHNAVYRICLSDKFDKNGKIITRKGDTLDALTIMKEHCRTIDKCLLDDLLNYEKDLTGEVHRWIPMEAGNTVLVRIDKDTYVADRYVRFNIEVIDDAIERFVNDDYLPLKSFTTFGVFPDCGQTWTLFLLESYCRRFSRKFRFDTPSVNSRNAGVVIRKSCVLNYTEIMADAVANVSIPLNDSAVGKFLYDNGYTGKSTTARVVEIIDKAKAIRESSILS
jgi:hypothetical protein